MSGSVNRATLLGNLGQDPKIGVTKDGGKIATVSIATSETWKDKASGEKKERTEWHRVVIFNPGLAEVAEKYLRKGSKVYVEGMLSTRKWTDQQGIERYTTEVVLKPFNGSLVLFDRQGGNGPPPADDPDAYGATRSKAAEQQSPGPDSFDDEIPF